MRLLSPLCPYLAAVAITLSASVSSADIYRWSDKDGVIHLTNRPRPSKKWKRVMKTGPGKASTVHAPRRRRSPRNRSSARYSRYDKHITEASTLYQIPQTLIRAVIHVESDYSPGVVSRAGAKGLMQLMPAAAKEMGVINAFDPRQNIFGGSRLLRILANRFNGDLVLTLAGYHAGAGAVKKYGGIPPYQTTQHYVRMVLSRYYKYKKAAAK